MRVFVTFSGIFSGIFSGAFSGTSSGTFSGTSSGTFSGTFFRSFFGSICAVIALGACNIDRPMPRGTEIALKGGLGAQCTMRTECRTGLECSYGVCKAIPGWNTGAGGSAGSAGAVGGQGGAAGGQGGAAGGKGGSAGGSAGAPPRKGWTRFQQKAAEAAKKKVGRRCMAGTDCGYGQFCSASERVCVPKLNCVWWKLRMMKCAETIWELHYPKKARQWRRGGRRRTRAVEGLKKLLGKKLVTPCFKRNGMFKLKAALFLSGCLASPDCVRFNNCLFKKKG